MKLRFTAAVTAALILTVSFTGCGESDKNTSSRENPPSNIESFAKAGRVDTLNIKIGDSVESVCEFYGTTLDRLKKQAEKDESNAAMSVPENDDDESGSGENNSTGESSEDASGSGDNSSDTENVQMSNYDISYSSDNGLGKLTGEDVIYYYSETAPENGIILIVAFDDPYLLTVGASTPEIVEAMVEDKAEYSGETKKDDWFFIFGEPSANSKKVIYSFDKYSVQFMFQEDLLFCVMLYNTEQWTQMNDTGAVSSSVESSQAGSS